MEQTQPEAVSYSPQAEPSDADKDRLALTSFNHLPLAAKQKATQKGFIDVQIGFLRDNLPSTASKRHRQAVKEKEAGISKVYRRVYVSPVNTNDRHGLLKVVAGGITQIVPNFMSDTKTIVV